MKSELIVDVTPQEIAIALTENDRLMEVNREKRGIDTFAVGNIYYGRVKKIMQESLISSLMKYSIAKG